MQAKRNRILSLCCCGGNFFRIVLIVAMALCTAGCSGSDIADTTAGTENEAGADIGTEPDSAAGVDPAAGTGSALGGEAEVLGEGGAVFSFSVVDQEGKETLFEIHTDKETVGEALVELGLIAGKDDQYGLYVETVNGITIDFDRDGKYWAFYVNGEYALTGVDTTIITEGESYSFRVE